MPLFILQLGESVMKGSSPEHSEDGGKIVRAGDGKKGLASGVRAFCFVYLFLTWNIVIYCRKRR